MKNYHKKYNSFYNSKEWQNLRNYKFAAAKGLCEYCLRLGVVEQGKEVHHIIPIDKNWNKRLMYDNLVLLCPGCHNRAHERVSQLQKFNEFWEGMHGKSAES